MRTVCLALLLSALLLASTLHAGDLLIGPFPNLYETADGSLQSLPGSDFLFEFAVDAEGTGWGTAAQFFYKIESLDPFVTEQVGVTNPNIRELAFHPDGTLWAIAAGPCFSCSYSLLTIDTATGQPTFVATLGANFQALAIADDGTFYAWRNGVIGGLVTLDPQTGAATVIALPPPPAPDIQWLALSACGTLYGGRFDLYTIDPATSIPTFIQSLDGLDSRGGAFLPQPLFADLGEGGLPGTLGTPSLTASGTLVPNELTCVTVQDALPSSQAYVVVGFTPAGAPTLGGTLVPSPDVIVGPLPVDASGAVSFDFRWPDLPPCTRSWWQAWVVDPGALQGFSASGALVSQSAP